ncbi:MAG: response regulator [Candidatus Margulisiibacteriota bacterium]
MAGKILIVDDDMDFVEAMASILESKGYSVVSASNGTEGLAKAKEEKPDLMLLDVMMSSKTEGFDLAKNLKNEASTRDLPVIMITGIRKDMNLPFGFEPDPDYLPVAALLEKPIKPDELLKAVEANIKK